MGWEGREIEKRVSRVGRREGEMKGGGREGGKGGGTEGATTITFDNRV